ncbi:MAG: hypothetical protein AAF216_11310 [Pseudomonadota bacterium]
MTKSTGIAGRGALITIIVIEVIIAVGALGVGIMTGRWMPVIVVLVLAGAISAMSFMRLNQLGN